MLMSSWLRNVKSNLYSDSRQRARAATRRKKLSEPMSAQTEVLEDRTLLSVAIRYADDAADPNDTVRLEVTTDVIAINGNSTDDEIVVRSDTTTGLVEVLVEVNGQQGRRGRPEAEPFRSLNRIATSVIATVFCVFVRVNSPKRDDSNGIW